MGHGGGVTEVKVPVLDQTGKVAAAFWPPEVTDLGANVVAAAENAVAAQAPALIEVAVEAEVDEQIPVRIADHNSDTTAVHGIADTGLLVTFCTTATRPAAPVEGRVVFDTDVDRFFVWRSGQWVAMSSAVGGGPDSVLTENDLTVTTDYAIPSGRSAMSTGPVTVNTGVTVTIPAGSVWVVL